MQLYTKLGYCVGVHIYIIIYNYLESKAIIGQMMCAGCDESAEIKSALFIVALLHYRA